MSDDVDNVGKVFGDIFGLENSQRTLMAIFNEFKERTGEPAMFYDENGTVFVHHEVQAKLGEPGNKGALEFLRMMQRTGITKPDQSEIEETDGED